MTLHRHLLPLFLFIALASTAGAADTFGCRLSPWMPPPPLPEDNPMSASKVEICRGLFYDIRLSGPDSVSCATCHQQNKGSAVGKRVPTGITGEHYHRNSMGLSNIAYFSADLG